MTFDQTNWVWMNGEIVPWGGATVHVSAHALHYGSGVFEGMRCYETEDGAAVFRMREHLQRLYSSAEAYGIQIPYSKAELENAVCETIRWNEFTSCYIRPICYHGSANLAVHPRNCPVEVVILAWPWGAYLGEDNIERGVRVTLASWTKFHSRMLPTTAKGCGGYLNSMLAAREAHAGGFDEALLLDESGNIAEGSGENLFLVREGRLLTNDERSSILIRGRDGADATRNVRGDGRRGQLSQSGRPRFPHSACADNGNTQAGAGAWRAAVRSIEPQRLCAYRFR